MAITTTWKPRLNYQGLSKESQETFRRINLRWHDLRHEYASRLVEHGVPLAQVRDLLGHASITTTERYDNQTLANLQVAAAKLERGGSRVRTSVAVAIVQEDRDRRRAGGYRTVELPGRSLTVELKLDGYSGRPGASDATRPTADRRSRSIRPGQSGGRAKFQDSFKIGATAERTEQCSKSGIGDSSAKCLKENDLGDWLGGRDSNPDNHVQSVVSYR